MTIEHMAVGAAHIRLEGINIHSCVFRVINMQWVKGNSIGPHMSAIASVEASDR